MQIKNFEDLEISKVARSLTHEIYTIVWTSKLSRDYGLRDQRSDAKSGRFDHVQRGRGP